MKKNNKTTNTNRFARLLGIIMIMISIIKTVTAQPGTLDSSFGENGKVTDEMYGSVYCTALQTDGKIVVGGVGASTGYPTLARYNANGSIDESFGENGKVLTDLFTKYLLVYADTRALAIQKDGKIVAVGYGFSEDRFGVANYYVVLLRYNSDGSFDEAFGDSGVVISDFEGGEIANDVALQPDGKIVIAGQSRPNLLVARYNTDGSFDDTFGGKGWVTVSNGGRAYSLALQDDGKIVTGGVNDGSSSGFILVRVETDGTPDSSFGVNGKVVTDFGGNEYIKDIAIGADGKIIAAGKAYDYRTASENIALIRYSQDGSIDSNFGIQGYVTTVIEGYYSSANNILIDEANNKIIAVCNFFDFDGSTGDFLVVRYNKDGSLNDNFGEGGIQTTDFGGSNGGQDGVLQPDGKIVAVGYSGYKLMLVRYNGNPEETLQITRIKKWLHRHGFSWDDFPRGNKGHFSIERSGNGIAFNRIARLQRSGNQQQYSYEDQAPLNGTNYYRVSAVSEDGSAVQSNIITIENNAASIKVFPIPARNNIKIEGLPAAQKTKLSIIDYSGNVKAAATVNSGSYNWHIAHLKPGNYLLKIETGNTFFTQKFTKE